MPGPAALLVESVVPDPANASADRAVIAAGPPPSALSNALLLVLPRRVPLPRDDLLVRLSFDEVNTRRHDVIMMPRPADLRWLPLACRRGAVVRVALQTSGDTGRPFGRTGRARDSLTVDPLNSRMVVALL